MKLSLLALVLSVALSFGLPNAEAGRGDSPAGRPATAAFAAFLEVMKRREPIARTETGERGYVYNLVDGRLSVSVADGTEIWQSDENWWVQDFRLGDVDGDGAQDFIFTVWKSYRFGDAKPARMSNDDETVRCHLFLYTILSGYVKPVWCSSDLPRPIYSFELDKSGRVTPVASGMLLKTAEGEYRDDFSLTETKAFCYAWEGWGFVPVTAAEQAQMTEQRRAQAATPERARAAEQAQTVEQRQARAAPLELARAAPLERAQASEQAVDLKRAPTGARIAFTGDLMVHEAQLQAAYNSVNDSHTFESCFEQIAPRLKDADYTVGNLETTLAGPGAGYTGYPAFNTPDAFAMALKHTGFNFLSTANNHAGDRGEAGILRTIDVLDAVGLEHAGTYASKEDQEHIFIKEFNGIRFAFLAYTYGSNNATLPQNKPYLLNMLDESLVRRQIGQAREQGADVVIVLPHMGVEYGETPDPFYSGLAERLCKYGADAVMISHPHVLQPVEVLEATVEGADRCYGVDSGRSDNGVCGECGECGGNGADRYCRADSGRVNGCGAGQYENATASETNGANRTCFIAYSMGNFISSQRLGRQDTGAIFYLDFERRAGGEDVPGEVYLARVSFLPTWVQFHNADGQLDIKVICIPDALAAIKAGAYTGLRQNDIFKLRKANRYIQRKLSPDTVLKRTSNGAFILYDAP